METFNNQSLGSPIYEALKHYTLAVVNAAEDRVEESILKEVFGIDDEGTIENNLWELPDLVPVILTPQRKQDFITMAEEQERLLGKALKVVEAALPHIDASSI
jgi:hypothetical protein